MPALFEQLAQLPHPEMEAFRAFVQSPYFNRSQPLVKLVGLLASHHPHLQGLSEAGLLEAMAPGETRSTSYLPRQYSELRKLLEQFQLQRQFEADAEQQARYRRDLLFHTGSFPDFEQACREELAALEGQALPSARRITVLQQLLDHTEMSNAMGSAGISRQILEAADAYFVYLRLKYYSDLQTYGLKKKVDLPEWVQAEVVARAEALREDFPLLPVYANIVQLLQAKAPMPELFRETLETFRAFAFHKDHDERQFLAAKLTAIGLRGYRHHPAAFGPPLQALFEFAAKRGIYLEEGQMSVPTLLNVTMFMAQRGAFAWAWAFVGRHSPFLPAAARDKVTALAGAFIHFYAGDYQKAITQIPAGKEQNHHYKLHYSTLSLRCLLGLQLTEGRQLAAIKSARRALELLIRRDKLLKASEKVRFRNFARAVEKLANLHAFPKPESDFRTEAEAVFEACQPMNLELGLRQMVGRVAEKGKG